MHRRGNWAASRRTVYKLCSLALQYPDEEIVARRVELVTAAAELPGAPAGDALGRFFSWFTDTAPLDLARHYVQTFDLHKRSALYMTFYSLGDRRDRGLALLRLKKLYRAAGLPLEGSELPDYLPVMLEFAAAAAPGGATSSCASIGPRSSSSAYRSASSKHRTGTCSTPCASRSVGCPPASGSVSTGS